jgi:acyl-CoA thioesterase
MDANEKARRIVDLMMEKDAFSQWLGIERIHHAPGECILQLVVRDEMLNGFLIAHGGISYSLADSALAFASNSHGPKCVSVETSISHVKSAKSGDLLRAEATELSRSNKIAVYQITVTNQLQETVALFKGTVYRTSQNWDEYWHNE